MVRLHGRAPQGERATGSVPFAAWQTFTLVAALRDDCMTAPMMIKGAMNSETFLAYVKQWLVPTLKPGDIVIMDNVPAHKGEATHVSALERFITFAEGDFRLIDFDDALQWFAIWIKH
jgi:hypothetical protein